MANFAAIYTPEQRRAVAGAMLGDHGKPMTARQAVEAANRGELGTPPFQMPAKTAYAIRDREQLQRKAATGPPPVTVEDRARALIERELSRIERVKRGDPADMEKLRQVIRAARELERGSRTPPKAPALQEDKEDDLIAQITQREQAKEDTHAMHNDEGEAAHAAGNNDTERGREPVRLLGSENVSSALACEMGAVA